MKNTGKFVGVLLMLIDWLRRVLGGRGFQREREDNQVDYARALWDIFMVLSEIRDLMAEGGVEGVTIDWEEFGEVLLCADIGNAVFLQKVDDKAGMVV